MKELPINEANKHNISDVANIFRLFMESIRSVKVELATLDKSHLLYINERAFAYEFYRQITNRLYSNIEDWKKWQDEEHVVVNAEIYKHINKKEEYSKYSGVYPDIVIHGGQYNKEKQLLICEIKKEASYNGIHDDAKKLLTYMDYQNMYGTPFPLGVFVNVGCYDKFIKNIEKLSIEGPFMGCLIFISYDKGDVKIVKKYISDIFNISKGTIQINKMNIPMYKVISGDEKFYIYQWNSVEHNYCDYIETFDVKTEAEKTAEKFNKSYLLEMENANLNFIFESGLDKY